MEEEIETNRCLGYSALHWSNLLPSSSSTMGWADSSLEVFADYRVVVWLLRPTCSILLCTSETRRLCPHPPSISKATFDSHGDLFALLHSHGLHNCTLNFLLPDYTDIYLVVILYPNLFPISPGDFSHYKWSSFHRASRSSNGNPDH